MPGFAFFDLDHTLLPFDTQTLFANYVLRRERWRSLYLLTFAPFAIGRAVRLTQTSTAKSAFLNYAWGMKRERLQDLAADFADTDVKKWIYPELVKAIEEHRVAGRTLILNTASPDYYPHEIARMLGFHHCFATKIERRPTVQFMPRVIGLNNKREEKIAVMMRELPAVAQATPEQMKDSWMYTDSKADLPLLELAGHGVLIHPHVELASMGRERGWEIWKPARPYETHLGQYWCSIRQALGLW
jgi:HAD superfamily hydrolase (TIGR01490 family)